MISYEITIKHNTIASSRDASWVQKTRPSALDRFYDAFYQACKGMAWLDTKAGKMAEREVNIAIDKAEKIDFKKFHQCRFPVQVGDYTVTLIATNRNR